MTFMLVGVMAHAVGLGQIHVQSALGQPLRASVPLLGADHENMGGNCIKAKLISSDGAYISSLQLVIARGAQASTVVLSLRQPVNEPAVTVSVDVGCETPVRRDYSVLLDPPQSLPRLETAHGLKAV